MFNKYEIASNIAVAGLDTFEGKMSAKQQRAIFGAAFFGRKNICIDNTNQGRVTGSFVGQGYGTGLLHFEISFERLAEVINNGAEYHGW
jgi:hypothetical protein